jgi:predicted CopG family antitoxin
MRRKLTITVSDEVYRALHHQVGRGSISRFIEELVRPHVTPLDDDLERLYRESAGDEAAECEAMEWIEADLGEPTH